MSGRAVVVLAVREGPSAGRRFTFFERTTCVVGRAVDCEPRLPEKDRQVSRHHCLFDINPPDIRVRDFGSLNGTYVNGERIGRREPGQTPEEGALISFPERDLAHGDEVRLGRTLLRVEIADRRRRAAPVHCAHCGRDVERADRGRDGDVVCAECRRNPRDLLDGLLSHAQELRDHEVVRELGRGGQGVVHLARHRGTGALVAIKVLLAEVAVSGHVAASFLREIEAGRALRHPNIVAGRGSGTFGASFYLVSEYCEGGSVEDLLAARGRLPVDEAVPIALGMLDGLHHAHTQGGLVHRDIKPANVLLTGRRVPKIGDFGLAKAFDQAGLSGLTRTGTAAGSVAYLPRTQLLNFKYSKPEVDVWATAATLYRMLTGTTPRDFPPTADPILIALQEPAVPIRQRDPSIPRRLAEAVDEALEERPITVTSANALGNALREATGLA